MTIGQRLVWTLLLTSVSVAAQTNGQSGAPDVLTLRRAAEQGDAHQQWELGDRYYTGKGVDKDHAEAMKWYRKAAEQGDAQRQFSLGFMYWIDGDNTEAANWYLRAAKQGHFIAQTDLGDMYRDGKGVPQNYAEAVKWYRKASENETVEQGPIQLRPQSQHSLGTLYEKGLGVPQDYAEAAKWYRKAVEGGSAFGVFSLYDLCANGKSTKQDCTDVAKWLAILANQEDRSPLGLDSDFGKLSPFYLGMLYEKGLGVPQDYAEAAKWYRTAADRGHSGAQMALGYLYIVGKGVPQDFVVAHMWTNIAASRSPAELQALYAQQRDRIATMMTPAQIAEAQRLAREWKPKDATTSKASSR
jgi:TPR repeat protein